MTTLNGWQRIGIVLSVIWALAIAALGALENSQNGDPTNYFVVTVKVPVPQSKAIAPGRTVSFEEFVGYRAEYHFNWWRFLGALLIPITLFWIIAYIGVYVARWIAAGFRRNVSGRGDR